jgi:uncharacterized cofD-like protein
VSSGKKKIVIIGGGNGSSMLISSLKDDFEVAAIVSMADDGGSTGRLRKELGTSAVGDIRQCLVALADSEYSKKLFSHRFSQGELEGHSFGNLFLASIEKATGSLYKAIEQAKNILEIKTGKVVPVTDDKPELEITGEDLKIKGVYEIANTKIAGKKAKFSLSPSKTSLSIKAEESIGEADLIIIAPGNFYCSIIPALIVGGMGDTLSKSPAKKVLVANLANFQNHTKGYGASDYFAEIARLTGINFIDTAIINNNPDLGTEDEAIDPGPLPGIEIIEENLVSNEKLEPDPNDKIALLRSKVRHDESKLNKIITQILRS